MMQDGEGENEKIAYRSYNNARNVLLSCLKK